MQVLYARYNRHRLPHFQLATLVVQEGAQRYVLKRALNDAARPHLMQIRRAHQLLEQNRRLPRATWPALLEEFAAPDTLACEFINAPSVEQVLLQAIRRRDSATFWDALDDYHRLLSTAFGSTPQPVLPPPLRNVLGNELDFAGIQHGPCSGLAFLDASFENVLIRGTERVFIDNEWVLEGALPVDFALYRSLFYFFKVKFAAFDLERFIAIDEILQRYKISAAAAALYRDMEESFQAHVFGADRCYAYLDRYAKYGHTSIASLEQTIAHQRQVVAGLHAQISAMVNSSGWRFLEKLRRIFSAIAPPGSRRRRWCERLFA